MAHPREPSDVLAVSQDTTFSEAIERLDEPPVALGEPPSTLGDNPTPSGARKSGEGTPQVESATRNPANADIKAAAADPIPIASHRKAEALRVRLSVKTVKTWTKDSDHMA